MDEQKISSIEHAVGSPSRPLRRRGKGFLAALFLLLLVFVICAGAWYGFKRYQAAKAVVPGTGYQAVFLEGGQVYFGKLTLGRKWLVLDDVFYLQTTPANTQSASSNFQLVKLGSEIYGPEDRIYLSPQKVLYWENIRPDSRVADAIGKFKSEQK